MKRALLILLTSPLPHDTLPNMTCLSIITVVYNDAEALDETLQSIHSQQFSEYEHIIIDGGSTDGTLDVIKSYDKRISFWSSEADNGIYDAMNKGIQKATGEWITFLNAGDRYKDHTSLSSLFDQDLSTFDFCYADMILLTESGHPVRSIKAETLTKSSITKGMIACHQAMFVRRHACPFYKDHLRYQGDLDWVMTILDTLSPSRLYYMPKELVYFKSGGFSDQTIYHQLQEHLQLIYQRYGLFMIIYRVPRLLRRYLGKWGRKWLGISTFRFWQ